MTTRIDYEQVAAKLDYTLVDKKLEQLAQCEPPKSRKTAADLLEPLRERLLALHCNGWNSQQLADELRTAGMPVNVARLRECLNLWTTGGKAVVKRRGSKRDKSSAPIILPPVANQSARNKSTSGDGQPKFGLA